ncbi:MAG: exonuclease domain-containing protein [Lutibacter sp.]|nr:exonuclease domain-containing protein [Lutibacter sp.]
MAKETIYNLYAILDIETTGGKFNEEGITEIAIYKYDGHTIVDQFISLINPEREIQPFVVNLTGINSGMLKNAPKFFEVAKRIIEITTDCVIVAHNANFDNRILTTEYRRLGYEFERETLCTVELSQKLIPDLDSYKLGKLCRTLGIPVSSRHRAEGDALATVKLFKLLMNKDNGKEIIKTAIKKEIPKKIAPKLQSLLENLPTSEGLFYIQNETDILYIGKGKNIKKAANQLFLKDSKRAIYIQNNVVSVLYEETGNALISELKFVVEIIKNKPKFNQLLSKRNGPKVSFNNDNFIMIEKGRTLGEKSVILVENNILLGYCYIDLSYQLNNLEILKSLISKVENSNYNRLLIKKYFNTHTLEKLIRF